MDMETITMWANMSSSVADALRKKSPAIDVRNVITDTDIAKIRKDSENAIVLDKSYERGSNCPLCPQRLLRSNPVAVDRTVSQ